MSYPVAANVYEALMSDGPYINTFRSARDLAIIEDKLALDWVKIPEIEKALPDLEGGLKIRIDNGISEGFVQVFEDATGAPIYAVSYWKTLSTAEAIEKPLTVPRKRSTRKNIDPNQLDLFGGNSETPAQKTTSSASGLILSDEEGDGLAFGRSK